MGENEQMGDKLSLDELDQVNGGVEMRTTKICPVCRSNLFKKYVVFPFHQYKYYCETCKKYIDIEDEA